MAAARRIAILTLVVFGTTAAVSAGIGALAGASLDRSVSLGFYLVGCFAMVLGFFSGIRGPVRRKGRGEDMRPLTTFFGAGLSWSGVRTATEDERIDARSTAWLLLLLGVGLIAAGAVVDSRTGLV